MLRPAAPVCVPPSHAAAHEAKGPGEAASASPEVSFSSELATGPEMETGWRWDKDGDPFSFAVKEGATETGTETEETAWERLRQAVESLPGLQVQDMQVRCPLARLFPTWYLPDRENR